MSAVDVLHVTWLPPFAPGSYNRWVGVQLRQSPGFTQCAVSFWKGPVPESADRRDVLLVNDSRLSLRQKGWLHIPAVVRQRRFGNISDRDSLIFAWALQEILPELKPKVVVLYDLYKVGPLLRKVIDWPCRLVLSQRGLSYFLEGNRRQELFDFRTFDVVWVLSGASYAFDSRRGHSYEPLVCVLPNGVDTRQFCPVSTEERLRLRAHWDLPQENVVVLLLSRLVPKKGAHVILHSWPRILQRVPEAYLWIVGGGEPGYESALARLARALGVEARVRLQGAVPPSLTASCYQAADAYVFPTLCTEGMAMTLLEAMSCGLACIASDHDMARALYRQCDLVWVPAPNVEDAFVDPIVRVLQSAELRNSLGAAARETVLQGYSQEKALDRIREFYRRQLAIVDGHSRE